MMNPEQYALHITGEDGFRVGIRYDGAIDYAGGYTPDKAARTLWEAIARHRPAPNQALAVVPVEMLGMQRFHR